MQFAPTEPEQFEPFVGGFDGQAMEDAPPVACVPPIPELPPIEVEPPPTDRFPPEPTVSTGSEPEQAERHANPSNSAIAKHRNWVSLGTGIKFNTSTCNILSNPEAVIFIIDLADIGGGKRLRCSPSAGYGNIGHWPLAAGCMHWFVHPAVPHG